MDVTESNDEFVIDGDDNIDNVDTDRGIQENDGENQGSFTMTGCSELKIDEISAGINTP